jgi:tRNA pseudouridine38-40 synthase
MRLALKFGYDGRGFHGFARQPGQKTVEGDILKALAEIGILKKGQGPRDIGYAAASRTDAGVSAIGNVIALDTSFRKDALLSALNARLRDVWFHSLAQVPAGFRPRDARRRWYRYHMRDSEGGSLPMFRRALSCFEGTHDFSNFARIDDENPVRTVKRVSTRKAGGLVIVDVRAQSFLWNQVRRMMGAALAVSNEVLLMKELKEALDKPQNKKDMGLASPEGLMLVDVSYGFRFKKDEKALALARRFIGTKMKEAEVTLLLGSYMDTGLL